MKPWSYGVTQKVFFYLLLAVVALAFLLPMVYMFTNSFMDSDEILNTYAIMNADADYSNKVGKMELKLIPDEVSLMQYYRVLLRKPLYLRLFWNSMVLTVPIVLGQIVVGAFAAFSFSKLRFPFRDKIFFIYIIVMMMPFQVTLVPNYIMIRKLDIIGSYLAVILPGIFTSFGVFLLRQFMRGIPDEYCESAKMDGAGYLRILLHVMLPQCKSGMASLAILSFIDNWNMVEQPLVFLENSNMHPLSIFLSGINGGATGLAFASGILYMTPPLLMFLYGENYFVQGIQLTGIK